MTNVPTTGPGNFFGGDAWARRGESDARTSAIDTRLTTAETMLAIYSSAATGWTPNTSFVDTGAAITLPAGKWFLQGVMGVDTSTAVAERYTGQLWDDTTATDLYQNFVYGSTNLGSNIILTLPLTLTAAHLIKMRLKTSTVQGAQFLAQGRLWALPANNLL